MRGSSADMTWAGRRLAARALVGGFHRRGKPVRHLRPGVRRKTRKDESGQRRDPRDREERRRKIGGLQWSAASHVDRQLDHHRTHRHARRDSQLLRDADERSCAADTFGFDLCLSDGVDAGELQ
jgi:hypothetical protein